MAAGRRLVACRQWLVNKYVETFHPIDRPPGGVIIARDRQRPDQSVIARIPEKANPAEPVRGVSKGTDAPIADGVDSDPVELVLFQFKRKRESFFGSRHGTARHDVADEHGALFLALALTRELESVIIVFVGGPHHPTQCRSTPDQSLKGKFVIGAGGGRPVKTQAGFQLDPPILPRFEYRGVGPCLRTDL